jgi:hypothetical protein
MRRIPPVNWTGSSDLVNIQSEDGGAAIFSLIRRSCHLFNLPEHYPPLQKLLSPNLFRPFHFYQPESNKYRKSSLRLNDKKSDSQM